MTYTIYKHTSPEHKVYIGCTTVSIEARRSLGYGGDFQHIVAQYGWNNITTEILATATDKDTAKQLEQHYIAEYDAMNPDYGYNRIQSGFSMTEERREQLSKKSKEYWADSNHVEAMKQAIAPSRASKEYRDKVSQTLKRKHQQDPEFSAKQASHLEITHTPEMIAQITESLREYWSDEQHRQEQSIRMKEVMNRPEILAKMEAFRSDENYLQRMRELGNDPQLIEKRREGLHKMLSDPERLKAFGNKISAAAMGRMQISKIIDGTLKRKWVHEDKITEFLNDGWVRGWKGV